MHCCRGSVRRDSSAAFRFRACRSGACPDRLRLTVSTFRLPVERRQSIHQFEELGRQVQPILAAQGVDETVRRAILSHGGFEDKPRWMRLDYR